MKPGIKCPNLDFVSSRASTAVSDTLVQKIKSSAYASLVQDDAFVTDPRMAEVGKMFMECDGIGAMYRLIGRSESVADDARHPKKSLHRSAYPLARFLSLHVANQQNQVAAAVGRRMKFGKMIDGKSVAAWQSRRPSREATSGPLSPSTSKSTSKSSSKSMAPRKHRVRSSWHVSPLLFRVIVTFTRAMDASKKMVGGRLLGTGRNETKVYTFDDIQREHPKMRGLCMHMYGHLGMKPACFSGRDAAHVMSQIDASSTVLPRPFLSRIALKDILDDEEAGTELQYHHRIHRWFTEVHNLHLTSLHPELHFMELDETAHAGGAGPDKAGHRVLVTRLMYGDVHNLYLREDELLALSTSVLRALEIFHSHHYLHMDIKPDNILWDLDDHNRRMFCLSDYNLIMSDASLTHYLRPDDGGDFQSLTHGTEGYKSPLLMADDHRGGTYRTFAYVAVRARAYRKKATPVWKDYFEKARAETTMDKVDLHSLALTLFKMAVPHGQNKKETLRLMQGSFGKFVSKLMFFRPHDFKTATQALKHLQKQSSRVASKSRR